jgi:Arc-like DNA binding domain
MKNILPDFKIRLPQHLKSQIESAARENNRSMNGEIVARLERSFSEPIPLSPLATQATSDALTGWGNANSKLSAKIEELTRRYGELETRLKIVESR